MVGHAFMSGKQIGYARVSTAIQNPDRQLEGILLDKKFVDYCTGTTMARPQLDALLDYVRDDDIVVVHSMDRLARNVKGLREVIDMLISKGVQVRFIKENLTFSGDKNPMSDLLLSIMGAIAEFEHAVIRERQLEGVALAKKAGKYRGRKRKLTYDHLRTLREQMTTRKSKSQIAREFGVSRVTLNKYLKEIEPLTLEEIK
jgi:DNA invertase Pin-like site-specific DNA recombinase